MAEISTQSKKEKLEKQNARINKMMLVPIIVLLAIVPLIVRLDLVTPSAAVMTTFKSSYIADFFSQYKATAIILVTAVILIMTFLLFQKEDIKKDKYIITYLISTGVFLGVSFLATLGSDYKDVAWSGVPDRAEGMIITACYIVMLIYTIYTIKKQQDFKYIVIALAVLTTINAFLGAFQYFGHDLLLKTDLGKAIVVPSSIADQVESLSGLYESGNMYGTMFHYNYVGSFGAMVVPLFLTLTLFIKGRKNKLFLGVTSLIAMFFLFGSTSRAGLVGLALAIVVGLIVFGKQIIRKWKIVVPVIGIFLVVLVAFNAITGGTIFSRVPTLIHDAFGMFGKSDDSFDYKEHIPVKDVMIENGEATIVLQTGTLTLQRIEGGVKIVDEEDKEVGYTYTDEAYITQDPRFSHITFQMGSLAVEEGEPEAVGIILVVDGIKALYFKVDEAEGVYLMDAFTQAKIELEEPETFGFKGKEKLGSSRGYIWSRSIPMLKDTWLIGNGPDTFALAFPQNDLLGKWWGYDTPHMVVDKPHNMYLQFALNNGGLALLAFLVLVGVYIADSMRLYALKAYYESKDIIGIATMLAIIGYLGAAIFNDSIISVAPIFWILLGTGIAINYINNKERKEIQKRVTHATVNMKTKKRMA